MPKKISLHLSFLLVFQAVSVFSPARAEEIFNFKRYLFDPPSTLSLSAPVLNLSTGEVTLNGIDSSGPSIPFTFDWGDGTTVDGWFPQDHQYADLTENYVVKVTSHYSNGTSDRAAVVVLFTSLDLAPISLPSDIAVTIPDHSVTLQTRLYGLPPALTYFDDGFFTIISRSAIEYVLSAAASIQKDFVSNQVFRFNGKLEQVLLRDPSFGGMYSLWFTDPMSFGVGDYGFQGTIQWSSFLHEMGHNFTLNTPAHYYYGGRIDGNANAIFSESMAQIFQHATAYEMINRSTEFGLGEDATEEVKNSATSSIRAVRDSYERYLDSGLIFSSWNDPLTPADETFDTFMTIAYKFFAHAENAGGGYKIPLKRMMKFEQIFDPDLAERYNPLQDTVEAARFRATLMVTALSYAFGEDLRAEFEALNFPIDDSLYVELQQKVAGNLIGSWDGQGVYFRDSTNDQWTILATPADLIGCGDLSGDGKDDLIGIWASQAGVWTRNSADGSWAFLSSTARHIASGDMNGDARSDFLGTWDGQGVFYRDSASGGWTLMASPANLITAGDLDGDTKADLIGIWPTQAGVWVKYSLAGSWNFLGSSARDMTTGDMNGDGRADLVGTWDGQGVFSKDSISGLWTQIASPADQITAGDLDGDGTDDLIGIWSGQAGIWVKYSQSQTWDYIGSSARDIATGKMAGGAWSSGLGKRMTLSLPMGGYPEGPMGAGVIDLSAEGPGGSRFIYQAESNLMPPDPKTIKGHNRIAGPGESGFKPARQSNLFPGQGGNDHQKETRRPGP
jgi:hypothetical protein